MPRIVGHLTLGLTACPGETLQLDIPSIRRMVQARIEEYGGPAPVTPPTDPDDPTAPPGGARG